MGCVAGTEQHGDTAFQSSGELRGVLRWGGLRSTNLIIGWNGKLSFRGRSLHFIEVLNPYQIVINIIGHTLHSRKSKQPIHVFGFGDSQTADQCVFTFSPTEVRVEVWSTSCGIQTSPRILC
ncbi:Copine [Phytophthora infestans]|uniref:Copine n=1 Tax=Phytophthora infestans TaxID=4787 RepID=A0A8S9V0R1_PHYIN|nr:Copine [Phytophthora infestans]